MTRARCHPWSETRDSVGLMNQPTDFCESPVGLDAGQYLMSFAGRDTDRERSPEYRAIR